MMELPLLFFLIKLFLLLKEKVWKKSLEGNILEKSKLFCYNIFGQKRDFHKKGQDGNWIVDCRLLIVD